MATTKRWIAGAGSHRNQTWTFDVFNGLRIISGGELEPGEYEGDVAWGSMAGGTAGEFADDFESTFLNFASDSAARCADIELGCRDTLSTLFACGREDSEHARLGSEMSCWGAIEFVEDAEEREELEVCA
ncbi:hypothetical protein C8Q75DRAFT_748616 [Abortiporus biennis]|nr:hypothetical protein C8Q75DRAFT_748616 [Abortiporus biennis]